MKQKRWVNEEDKILINSNLSSKELSQQLGRSIPSIKSRKKKLNLTKEYIWTKNEELILMKHYSIKSREQLMSMLPTRTWQSIRMKAMKLALNRLDFYHEKLRNNDLSILLENTCQSYYYMGLLMADGYITSNKIVLSQSIKDSNIVERFANYIKCSNIKINVGQGNMKIMGKSTIGHDRYVVNASNHLIVPMIREKFSIIYEKNLKTKTYYPPDISLFTKTEDDLLLAYIVGFIDGDGSISKNSKGVGHSITITAHKNWYNIFNHWRARLEQIWGINLSEKCLQIRDNVCRFRIYNSSILQNIKSFITLKNIIINENKWNKLNINN